MCNLYRLKPSRNEIASLFKAKGIVERQQSFQKDYAAPGKPGLIVREEFGSRLLDTMLWGFPYQGKPVTNVRNYASPFWRTALRTPSHRCLVPVSEFQEWSVYPDPQTGKKRPYWFSLPSRDVFAFAGIWTPASPQPFYSFLTCGYEGDPAAHVVGAIHPKAMPVILHEEDYDRWLQADLDDALKLASPFPSQLMQVL